MQKIKSHPNIIHAENNTFTLEIMTKDLSTKLEISWPPRQGCFFLFWVFPLSHGHISHLVKLHYFLKLILSTVYQRSYELSIKS